MTLADEFPISLLCDIVGFARSSFYYASTDSADDPAVVAAVEQMLAQKPFLGYRMVYQRMRRNGWLVSERQIRRLLRQFKRSRSAGRIVTTDSSHSHPRFPNQIVDVKAAYPDHVWVADLTYLRYGRQYLYLAIVLDVYTRAVRGWQLEEFMTCEALTKPALAMALQQGQPRYFHSDQGRQYAAGTHIEMLKLVDATISMSDAGKPTQNAFVERFIRTVKEEHVYRSDYSSFGDMRRQLKEFLEVEYNCERLHSSLGYMTPNEFESAYRDRQAFLL